MSDEQIHPDSLNITELKRRQLSELMPEIFSDGRIDVEKLKLALGEQCFIKDEHYELSWAGKTDAFKILQQPTTATLAPVEPESVNFDKTENIFIEGENLEVLKILQKSYFGKIKMIYIDPPYNTGSDSFIYPDKFSESKEDYLKRIGSKDEEGYLTKDGFFRKNSKDSGHYHSNWLTMMYPRLYLARNLLREDGVIFVSIDDNEVHNLRAVMNEIFGEENFLANIIWEKRFTRSNNAKLFTSLTEHILLFRKCEKLDTLKAPRNQKSDSIYSNPDNDDRGVWTSVSYVNPATKEQRPNLVYEIENPILKTKIIHPTNAWKYEKKVYQRHVRENRLYWGIDGNNTYPRLKKFLSEMEGEMVPVNLWNQKDTGTTDMGSKILEDLFSKKIFEFPKPPTLIKRMLEITTDKEDNDIVLDFFSGSGTTAQAVLELNKEDGGNRKFICVQLPEKTEEDSEAYKAGYKTIADIGKERIRRVIHNIQKEKADKPELFNDKNIDLGFKVFKLKRSNFKLWRGDVLENEEDLNSQIDVFENSKMDGAREENILYELMLKSGYMLSDKVEKKNNYYTVNEGELIIVANKIDDGIIKEILSGKPKKVIILDELFKDNDQLKTNTALQMKDAGIEFRTL
jgi:adenine-specific DNA-methyltransferase